MPQEKSTLWIDRILDAPPPSQSGDTIIGNVGSGEVIAIGKNIRQDVRRVLGEPKPEDSQQIANAIQQLREELQRVAPQLSDRQRHVAEDKIDTIQSELQKEDGAPSGELIRSAGDWLVDNIPSIGGALLSAFIPDPVGRVLAVAGTATITWIKGLRDRFG